MTITQVEHNTAFAAVVADAVSTNSPTGDCSHTNASSITDMRGGQYVAVVLPIGHSRWRRHSKSAADAKEEKSPADPLSIVVLNPNYNKACWSTHRYQCGSTRKVVEDRRATTPSPPKPLQHGS